MRRTAAIVLLLVLASCGGGGTAEEAQEPRDAARWAEAPAETERPPFIASIEPAPTPYLLDYGKVLWVGDDGIGRLIGDDWQDCTNLMGGMTDAEWHDRYADIPGFAGLVCNPPEV